MFFEIKSAPLEQTYLIIRIHLYIHDVFSDQQLLSQLSFNQRSSLWDKELKMKSFYVIISCFIIQSHAQIPTDGIGKTFIFIFNTLFVHSMVL